MNTAIITRSTEAAQVTSVTPDLPRVRVGTAITTETIKRNTEPAEEIGRLIVAVGVTASTMPAIMEESTEVKQVAIITEIGLMEEVGTRTTVTTVAAQVVRLMLVSLAQLQAHLQGTSSLRFPLLPRRRPRSPSMVAGERRKPEHLWLALAEEVEVAAARLPSVMDEGAASRASQAPSLVTVVGRAVAMACQEVTATQKAGHHPTAKVKALLSPAPCTLHSRSTLIHSSTNTSRTSCRSLRNRHIHHSRRSSHSSSRRRTILTRRPCAKTRPIRRIADPRK